jgi:hypothetical protein
MRSGACDIIFEGADPLLFRMYNADGCWDGAAELIWGTDLEIDNTILLRTTIAG